MKTSDARVVLVGSLPFSNAEETLRAAGGSLSGQHRGPMPTPTSRTCRKRSRRPPARWRRARHRHGRFLELPDQARPRAAVRRPTLRELRGRLLRRVPAPARGGVIPSDVRFQVSLPSPHSAIDLFFEDVDQWPEAYAAYLDGMKCEIAKILDAAPPSDLVFQWDCANEIVDVAMGDANAMKKDGAEL
jgi:hypothetical protein